MTRIKIYEYPNCSTCKQALKFLKEANVEVDKVNIFETAPTKRELRQMLTIVGDKKKLFNTSGQVYKEMKLAEKFADMSVDDAIALLSANGRLVKRPFVLWGKDQGTVGFKADAWKKLF